MQLFQFIFLNKNKTLQKSGLYKTAKAAVEHNLPYALLLFPEGTLVSRLTRPKSASFAAAQGIVSSSFLPAKPFNGPRIDLSSFSTLMFTARPYEPSPAPFDRSALLPPYSLSHHALPHPV